MTPDDQPEGTQVPEYAPGGLILAPGGADTVRVLIDPRYERIFTAEQAWRFMAAQPGSRDALA